MLTTNQTRRHVLFVLAGVVVLILKPHYHGPLAPVLFDYAGDFAVSFAVYFIVGIAAWTFAKKGSAGPAVIVYHIGIIQEVGMMKAKRMLAAGMMILSCAGSGWAARTEEHHRITVNGEAVVYAQPDKVTIHFGIETWDDSMAIAKKKNNEVMDRAIAAVRKLGVSGKEIQTDYLNIEPRYKNDYKKENFLGFFVSNTMAVTIAGPDKLELLVEKLLEAGIERIDGVQFQVSEFKKFREQARELALKAAKEKAEKMASVLGRGVGQAVQVSEGYSGWSGWGMNRQAMTQNVIQQAPGGGEDPGTIALGKISVRASVSVTFELK